VIIASSLERVAWRSIRRQAQRRGVASVLYMREASAAGHLTISKAPPDLLLANAQTLADLAAAAGYECRVAPSVVDLERSRSLTSRSVALLINPIVSHGVDVVLGVARREPTVRFVLQESWPLTDEQEKRLCGLMAGLDNVEFRRTTDNPADVYRDARLLLAPYLEDQRPRVVLEALANGIPVLVSDRPGLVDAVRGLGIVVSALDVDAWAEALSAAWREPNYSDLVKKARGVAALAADERRQTIETVEQALEEAMRRVSVVERTRS
jgi:glycosyltransferase involved in cell wall biosynthesis